MDAPYTVISRHGWFTPIWDHKKFTRWFFCEKRYYQ